MESGPIFNIQRYSIQDGPGIRTTVFLKGCPLECWWCHNPESQSPEVEIAVIEGRCTQCGECRIACAQGLAAGNGRRGADERAACVRCGACVAACPTESRQMIGRRMTVDEVLSEVLKDRIFYDDSGGGVTFSGGEPLAQPAFLQGLLEACRAEAIHTTVDTCGFASQEQLLAIAALADLVLYDLKVIDDTRHRQYTGVSNVAILENLQALGRVHGNIWVRVPVVPGFNDAPEQLDSVARLAVSVPGVRQVNLLPYHATGVHKLARLDKTQRLAKITSPSSSHMEQAADRFRAFGLNTQTGG